MSHPLRRLAVESLIAVAVCAAAYSFLVRPVEQQLEMGAARYKSHITQATTTADDLSSFQLDQLDRTSARYRDEIARRSAHARDDSLMFAAIMTLASEHNVRVDQVRPTPTTRAEAISPTPTPAAPHNALAPGMQLAPLATLAPKDISTGYTLSVAAQYSDLAKFIEGLTIRTGFSVLTSIRITVDDTDPRYPVSAQIQTEHFAFGLTPVTTLTAAPAPAPREEGAPR